MKIGFLPKIGCKFEKKKNGCSKKLIIWAILGHGTGTQKILFSTGVPGAKTGNITGKILLN